MRNRTNRFFLPLPDAACILFLMRFLSAVIAARIPLPILRSMWLETLGAIFQLKIHLPSSSGGVHRHSFLFEKKRRIQFSPNSQIFSP